MNKSEMNIVVTGSLGNIGKPLTIDLLKKGHHVTVITSKAERQSEIEALGAKAAIGSFFDLEFLTETFRGADVVYLMEAWEGIGSIFDKDVDFVAAFNCIGNYRHKPVFGKTKFRDFAKEFALVYHQKSK
jgi:uncharacterized protein YbjT (DUF2867 family)